MAKISALISFPAVPDKFEKFEEIVDYLNDLVSATHDAIDSLQSELNGKIEVVNLLAKEISVTDTGDANTEFTVEHNMGRTPVYYIWNISKSGYIYDSRRDEWSSTEMYLKCSAANAELKILIPL